MSNRLLTSVSLSLLSSLSWAQTYLSPNQLGSGNLPGTHADLVFTLSNGNWTNLVRLPEVAPNQAKVKIVSSAAYSTQVSQANTDVPVAALSLDAGQSLEYVYSASRRRWTIVAPTVNALNDGKPMSLVLGANRVMRANLANGAWAANVILPTEATNGAVVLVKSTAAWGSRMDASNVMFASTMPLKTGQEYGFVFNARLGKWLLAQSPETSLGWSSLSAGRLPAPATPLVRLNIPAGITGATLRLPLQAGDRDRVIITSSAAGANTIANDNVPGIGSMVIERNQTYEFMWNAASGAWVMMQSPKTTLAIQSINGNVLPSLKTPNTEVLAWDGNWKPSIQLPDASRVGDRVHVRSDATWSFNVMFSGAAGMERYTVSTGDEVVFVRTASAWQRETDTVRLLLTYGQGVSARLGANAAKSRQLESLRLTNAAMANSGAKVRFQLAGFLEVPNLGSTLGEALKLAASHSMIQSERNRVAADAVYYEGVESGCGLAWMNATPNAYYMVATGSLNCGTNVMRHELGHNMGLDHGNGVVATVMSGNATPFFATPHRFDATLGVPLSQGASVPDEVSAINKNARAVASFR